MYTFIKTWIELKTDKRAVTALEYGLIAAAVVAVGLAGFSIIGANVASKFNGVKSALT
jgi:pilus assembly protein Flp/PilA